MIILIIIPTRSRAQNVEIYTDSTAQLIRGFGAAFIEYWQPDLTADHVETAFGLGEGQLGLSILRLGINTNPNQWSENLEAAKKASELGALIFASPWSPPAHMKTNNSTVGGRLREDWYDDYAGHLDAFNSYMRDNGVPLYAVSVQNEPDIQVSYESCDWSPDDMRQFIKDHASAIGTKVIAPESFQFRHEMSDPILNDSTATAHTDIIGGHIYGGGNARYPLAEERGKEVWMTEYLLNLNTGNISKPWNDFTDEERWEETMEMLRTVHTSMKSNMSAYVWWYLKRYYSFLGDGQFGETEGEATKRGYAFSQFSKFVRPNYVRLHSAGPVGRGYLKVYTTAYMDTTSQSMVLVAINDESSDKEVNFVFDDIISATFNRYITSIDQDVEQREAIAVTDSVFTVTLPKKTITTFVADQVSVSTEDAPEIPSGYDLNQNYPNPFNPSTVIGYQLPVNSEASLKVFDVLGREVATLVDGRVHAGSHQVQYNASGLPSGVYFYTLNAGDYTISKRMLLMR